MRSFAAAVILVLFLSACGQPPRRIEPDNLFWPLPPEKPRIHYIQSIYSEDDIGHDYSWRELLFGKTYIDSLARPYGVSARYGRICVTDIMLNSVMIFDLARKQVFKIGDEGAVELPAAVVSSAQAVFYVADAAQSKIAVYGPDGLYRTAFHLAGAKPVSLALNEAMGRLYVADRNNDKIIVLSLDGNVLFEFGGLGYEDGQLRKPLSIALTRTGNVVVLDQGNFRVQIFDGDGKFLRKFGSVGDRPGFFSNPKGIAVDSDNNIYVTDAAFSNFQIFDESGRILLFVGKLGSPPGRLYLPGSIGIDENDRIYVADQLNSRISVFQYIKNP